jgi:DNA-binding NarL/FixJ family response regulator
MPLREEISTNLSAAPAYSAVTGVSRKIRVLVIDDHLVVRVGLKALLSAQEDLDVIAMAESGETALALLKSQAVDVVLLDLRMPRLSGVESLRRSREMAPEMRIVVVSSYEYDEEIYAAVQAGAQGFVHKEADAQEILSAIRSVFAGRQAFPAHVLRKLTEGHMTAGLSEREVEVLQLVARGLTNKDVARTLNLSQFTVRNHLNHITQKLEATDRTEAIYIALHTGIISLP